MSVDLLVYSERREPVQRSALEEALRKRGWHCIFLEPDHLTELRDGPLDGDVVYGTKDASLPAKLRETLAKDKNQLEDFFEEGAVVGCGITAVVPFNPREEFGADFETQAGPAIAGEIFKANSLYNVHASGGHTELSFEFQEVVWKVLGALVGGLLEDPQTGEYRRCSAEGEEVLTAPDETEGSPIAELKKYFEAAKAAGFPVAASRNDVTLSTEALSQTDLERLLNFTREHFPKGDPSGSAMVLMTLEEYRLKKGKPFARDHAEWLTRMEETYGQF